MLTNCIFWEKTLLAVKTCLVSVVARRFGGIMARNPASYVSSLTLTVETNVREYLL